MLHLGCYRGISPRALRVTDERVGQRLGNDVRLALSLRSFAWRGISAGSIATTTGALIDLLPEGHRARDRDGGWKPSRPYGVRYEMDKLTRLGKLVFMAIAALAIVVAASAPSQARAMGGHGSAGGHPGGAFAHRGFDGHHGFHEHRGFHGHLGFGGPVYPYYYDPPVYGYEAPAYWYYCPSYGAYYPNVGTCPEAWVPVPAA
jgi:hypothetical protein